MSNNFLYVASFIKKNIKKLLYPIIYSYTAYKLFDFINRLSGYRKEKLRFFLKVGYYPDLKNPRSFNEKVLWKKIYDRNPLLSVISDKFAVRQYIKDVLGEQEAEKILIPLYYVTNKPQTIPFNDLPEEYAIKPNHASRRAIFAEGTGEQKKYIIIYGGIKKTIFDSEIAKIEIVNTCKEWLLIPYNFRKFEWAYQKIKRKIVIEKLLRDSSGKMPVDYKFSIFHGKCQMIQIFHNRYIDMTRGFYTPEWNYISVKGVTQQAPFEKKPENLKSMIDLAESLGKTFDYVRVDLYSINNRIYFGELTCYPMSGSNPFDPVSFDFELGKYWNIIPNYWNLKKNTPG